VKEKGGVFEEAEGVRRKEKKKKEKGKKE